MSDSEVANGEAVYEPVVSDNEEVPAEGVTADEEVAEETVEQDDAGIQGVSEQDDELNKGENDEFQPSDEEENDVQDENHPEEKILDYEDLSKLKANKRSNIETSVTSPVKNIRKETSDYSNQQVDHEVNYESIDSAHKRRQELEARLDRALKKPKLKKRKDEHDLTNDDDELVQILKQQMDEAAKKDAELIESQSGIAVNKIQLLPQVQTILSKANLAEVILDNNLLAEIRQWLEPLPDASLPSYEIQKTLFQALLRLPINTNHLRESGVGKILLFYQKSKRVEPKIKRIADKLISDWTRPIIGASDNYRDKRFHSIEIDTGSLRERLSKARSKLNPEQTKRKESEKSIYEQQASRRNRAAAPAPTVSDYKFAPKSRVNRQANTIASAGVGTSLNRDDQFKRINNKLTSRRSTVKKGGVSIEGRGNAGI